MRIKTKGLLLSAFALMVLTLLTPLAQATIYAGYDHTHSGPWTWELFVRVDTKADTCWVKWEAHDVGPWYLGFITPGIYDWYFSYVKVWDDKGFSWSYGPYVYPPMARSGEVTLHYTNTYTWLHAKVHWSYWVTSPGGRWTVTLDVDVYVGGDYRSGGL